MRQGYLPYLKRLSAIEGRPIGEPDIAAHAPHAQDGDDWAWFEAAASVFGLELHATVPAVENLASAAGPFLVVDSGKRPLRLLAEPNQNSIVAIDAGTGERKRLEFSEALKDAEAVVVVRVKAVRAIRSLWASLTFKKLRPELAQIALASAFINLIALGTPFFTMTIYNRVIGYSAYDTLYAVAIGMMVFYAFEAILRIVRARTAAWAGARVDAALQKQVMQHILRMPFARFEALGTGATAERLRQLDTIRNFLSSEMAILLVDLAFFGIFLTALAFVDLRLALLVVFAVPIIVGVSLASHRAIMRNSDEAFKAQSGRASILTETLTNAITVKALGLESDVERRWARRVDAATRAVFRTTRAAQQAAILGLGVQQLANLALLFTGAVLAIEGHLTAGGLIAATILGARALSPFQNIVASWHHVREVAAAAGRIDAILREDVETAPGETAAAPMLRGEIVLEKVSYQPDPDRPPILSDVSLTIEPGKVVALVGMSGAGKTTLAQIVAGVRRPTAGRVKIDGTDIAHMNPGSLRVQLGIVPQPIQLFAGTVFENIALGAPNPDEGRAIAAAKFVGAHDFIEKMPQGYASQLSEFGRNLSEGQRQLLAVARCVFRNPRLIILDEATSALDPETEERLMRGLRKNLGDRTLILITHRTAPLLYSDEVILMSGGRIERRGPPSDYLRPRPVSQPATEARQNGAPEQPAMGQKP